MAYENVPQISGRYTDGFFDTVTSSLQPKILVLGTATDGRTDVSWKVGQTSAAVREFRGNGTLIRGMYEVLTQGADNVFLRRLPTGTTGVLSGICSDDPALGVTIETVQEDGDVGARYSLWFESSTGRIAIYDTEEEEWIYDSEEILAIDTGLISVSGSCTVGDGVDVGTQSSPVAFEDCPALNPGVIVWTAGTDGESPSLMELYEALEEAYEDLDWSDVDFIVPMGATITASNVADLSTGQISSLGLAALTDYPVAGAATDVLGRLFKQEYQGLWYYFWDMDNDGIAEIFPSVGSATGSTDIFGDAISSSDFHEVNFAYQAAELCRKASTTWHTCIAFIGVDGPDGFDRSSLAQWIGDLPTYTEMSDGSLVVSTTGDNGSGLLGNKFLAGQKNFRGSLKDGGLIATTDGFLDGEEELDNNDHYVDIGKHVVVTYPHVIHVNQFVDPSGSTGRPSPYIACIATTVAGKYATLPEKEEANGPNGTVRGVKIDGLRVPGRLLNKLLGIRYVGIRAEPGVGVILAGSKTSARPDSDYTKISTIRSVNREIQGLRNIGMRYIGKEMSPYIIQALTAASEGFLKDESSLGYNNGSKISFYFTTAGRRLGQLKALLRLVPPFAIEAIDIETSLAEDESSL